MMPGPDFLLAARIPSWTDWVFALSDAYLAGLGVWLLILIATPWVLVRLYRHGLSARGKIAVKATFSCWLFACLLTVVEVYFAFVFDSTDSFDITNVSRVWYTRHIQPELYPLTFRSGETILFRDDRPLPDRLEPGQEHVCFLGDSFTFGHGLADVTQRFSNRLRTALDAARPGKYVVSNLADAGKDLPWCEAVVNRMVSDGRRIDVLVYVVCLNDIESYHANHMQLYEQIEAIRPRSFLVRETYFPNLLYCRLRVAAVPKIRDYYGFLADYYQGPPWQKMASDWDRWRQACLTADIDFRVVIFPFLQNLDRPSPVRCGAGGDCKLLQKRGTPLCGSPRSAQAACRRESDRQLV